MWKERPTDLCGDKKPKKSIKLYVAYFICSFFMQIYLAHSNRKRWNKKSSMEMKMVSDKWSVFSFFIIRVNCKPLLAEGLNDSWANYLSFSLSSVNLKWKWIVNGYSVTYTLINSIANICIFRITSNMGSSKMKGILTNNLMQHSLATWY